MTYASFLLRFVGTVGANLSYQVETLKDARLGFCSFCCGQKLFLQCVFARVYLGGTTSGRKRRSSASASTTQRSQTSSRCGGRGVKRTNVSSACAARASFASVVRHCLFWLCEEVDCSWSCLTFLLFSCSVPGFLSVQGMNGFLESE